MGRREDRNSTRQQAAHMKEKHRETGRKLDWWSTSRVRLWNPGTRHTYLPYLRDHSICKYLLYGQCECVNVNLCLFLELQDVLQAEPGSH